MGDKKGFLFIVVEVIGEVGVGRLSESCAKLACVGECPVLFTKRVIHEMLIQIKMARRGRGAYPSAELHMCVSQTIR